MNNNNLNFNPGGGGQPQLNIDPSTMPNFRCHRCGNQVFQALFIAKKVSALQSPSGKDGVAPMQIFACTNCGDVPAEFGGSLLERDETTSKPTNE